MSASRSFRALLVPSPARGLVRIARADLDGLGLRSGGTARLEGAGRTHVRVAAGQTPKGTLVLDPVVAANAGLSEDGEATLQPAELPQLDTLLLRVEEGELPPAAELAQALHDMTFTAGDRIALVLPRGRKGHARVVATDPAEGGLFGDRTIVTLEGAPSAAPVFADVGGLSDQVARVEELISTPLQRPDLYERLGISPPRGILFCGPPGSGKTLLARAVAGRTRAAFFHLSGPEIVSKHYGDSEEALRRVFEAARKRAPSIVFIDEIDAIAPRRDALSGEKQVERRIVAQLLTLLDGLEDRGRIVVMAATNLPDGIDPALRRPGRFDREIVFRPPSAAQRREIIAVHLARAPLDADVDLRELAETTHGYVGADLAALAREAAVAALARTVAEAGGEDRVRPEDLRITRADLARGLAVTGPSALRGTGSAPPAVSWEDVGGAGRVRDALRQAVLWPLRHAAARGALGVRPARGVLLTGPPGCGKTLAARALAAESGMNLLHVHPPRLLSQFLGEAERAVASLFATALATAPALIFFDEFDALAPRRSGRDATLDRIVAQLLAEFDGLAADREVVVLAATNRPGAIDPALLRPGRFDSVVQFTLPDAAERREILSVHLRGRACLPGNDLAGLAEATAGFSGAELATLVDEAARRALGRILLRPGEQPEGLGRDDIEGALAGMLAARTARNDDFLMPQGETTR
jgi:transitional endoplasmic reticulum ATPase